MRKPVLLKAVVCGILLSSAAWFLNADSPNLPNQTEIISAVSLASAVTDEAFETGDIIRDDQIQLCQGFENPFVDQTLSCGCTGTCNGACGAPMMNSGFGYGQAAQSAQAAQPHRPLVGVDQFTNGNGGSEAKWRDRSEVPWEAFGYGGYIGPYRTPHVDEYRLRVNDQLEFVYLRTRKKTGEPYRLFVGDVIRVTSAIDPTLNQEALTIRPDGQVSLPLVGQVLAEGKTIANLQLELDERYSKYVKNPAMLVQVTQGETPLQDLIASVDARQGQGGQGRAATVAPDGTVQLPGIGSIPAIGLTLKEVAREVNTRYELRERGINVTPILTQRAPRFVYVLGEAVQPGRYELTGPTTAMQAIALAQGFNPGGNLRQVIVFRRDHAWRLVATKLDLAGALYGKRPQPSDEIWLQDSDIVLIPKKPIQRLSEAVNLYLTETVYGIYPQAILYNFDNITTF
jgi:polysaccharide export outer membrane protein